MRIEIDQSGKIEDLRQDTVVGFSNKTQFSVFLSKELKRKLKKEFRKKVKQLYLKLFAICIFYSIKGYISKDTLIVIDREYEGKDSYIKGHLIKFIREEIKNFDKRLIRFGLVGKKSKAHNVVYRVKRNIDNPNKILSEKEVVKYLK